MNKYILILLLCLVPILHAEQRMFQLIVNGERNVTQITTINNLLAQGWVIVSITPSRATGISIADISYIIVLQSPTK